MLVKNVMVSGTDLKLLSSQDTISEAMNIMDVNGFLSIPVVDGDKFKGVISKNEIYKYYYDNDIVKDQLLRELKVENLLKNSTPVINQDEELEKAVSLLERMAISFVAVEDELENFKGILTHKAVFREFNNAFGLNKGERITVRAYDVPGQISKLSKIISANHGDIISFVVLDTKSVTQVKEITIKVRTTNLLEIKQKLKEAGFKLV